MRLPSDLVENGWRADKNVHSSVLNALHVFLIDEHECMFGIGEIRAVDTGYFEIGLRKELRA